VVHNRLAGGLLAQDADLARLRRERSAPRYTASTIANSTCPSVSPASIDQV
jgi:hypothetical protein